MIRLSLIVSFSNYLAVNYNYSPYRNFSFRGRYLSFFKSGMHYFYIIHTLTIR